jgi:hypothetical protein
VKEEAQLVTLTEPSDNPFTSQGEIKGLGSRKQQLRKKKKQEDLSYIKEEDVRKAVAKGAKLISYHES